MTYPEKVETRVSVAKDGTRQFQEHHTRPGPDGRSDWLCLVTSCPIQKDESPEQAAARSQAFAEGACARFTSTHILFDGFSAYHWKFPDGSEVWESFARPRDGAPISRPAPKGDDTK